MSDIPEMSCPSCDKTFAENACRYVALSQEHCPYCGAVVQVTEGFGGTDIVAMVAGDVAAIDSWLDHHAGIVGVEIKRPSTKERSNLWTFSTPYPWTCEVSYEQKLPNMLAIRFVTEENAEAVFANPARTAIACAKHGVQLYGYRKTKPMTEQVTAKWGVTQYLSLYKLPEELFEPILSRLDSAMKEVLTSLG